MHKKSWGAELLRESELGRHGCKAGCSTALWLERGGIFAALEKEKRGGEGKKNRLTASELENTEEEAKTNRAN